MGLQGLKDRIAVPLYKGQKVYVIQELSFLSWNPVVGLSKTETPAART